MPLPPGMADRVWTASPVGEMVSVTWVDGDSGWLDGRAFRLHGVDAPEGSPSRARCADERRKAARAKAGAMRLTAGKRARVSRSYGRDAYGRELVDLQDVGNTLVAAGHLKTWRYEQRQPKPDWCGTGR